jgi:hypothetical protein
MWAVMASATAFSMASWQGALTVTWTLVGLALLTSLDLLLLLLGLATTFFLASALRPVISSPTIQFEFYRQTEKSNRNSSITSGQSGDG